MKSNFRNQSQDPRLHNHNPHNNFMNQNPNRNQKAYNRSRSPNFFNNFNFGIREDFEDPFDNFGFNFPNFNQLQNQIFGNFNNMFNSMLPIRNGKKENENEKNNFNAMFNMKNFPGTMISKSYCSKVDYRDGKPHQECYQSQSINQFNQGHRISEKQEAYKNDLTGIQKAAHQRLLDDKGTKQIKQRNVNTGEQEEHNIYKGMKEDELDNFNKNYNDFRNKIGFQNNYKYLNALNNRNSQNNYIGDGRRNNNTNRDQMMQLGDGRNGN